MTYAIVVSSIWRFQISQNGTHAYQLYNVDTLSLFVKSDNAEVRLLGIVCSIIPCFKSGNIIVIPDVKKVWDENRDYFYPMPINERSLNNNLKQNQGWDDVFPKI